VTAREFRDRLRRRARRADVPLDPSVVEQLEAYYRLLARWNEKINLTALPLRELRDETIDRLLVEPLAAARHVPDSLTDWFDLGSGGGSPALPLKIVRPDARLTMVESRTRKAAFLREAVRVLGLGRTSVENARMEEVAARPGASKSAQLVTVRAVRIDRAVWQAANALLRDDGRLLLFRSDQAELDLDPRFRVLISPKLGAGLSAQLLVLAHRPGTISFHVEQKPLARPT
jgi:16S rRNA (guanine527-N7)-methyltransferase